MKIKYFFLTLLSASQLTYATTNTTEIQKWYEQESYIGHGAPISPIPALKQDPILATEFAEFADVTEGYRIEEHTDLVLARFHQFKDSIQLPEQISERDFVLFLSMHDIGKNLAIVEAGKGLYNSSVNKKTLELIYSRRLFKKVAREISMREEKVKILSRLLHSDTIGEYLKGLHSEHAAYNLLIRDAGKCGLVPIEFFNLHTLFHQIDAGSYPTLQSLFENNTLSYKGETKAKMALLQGVFQKFEDIKPGLVGKICSIFDWIKEYNRIVEDLKVGWKTACNDEKPRELHSRKQDILTKIESSSTEVEGPFYQYLLQTYYSFNFDELSTILDLVNDNESDIANYDAGYFTSLKKILLYNFKVLKKIKHKPDTISGVHGASSAILFGLMQTSAILYPTGTLVKLGIPPLSGELQNGATITSRNRVCISGNLPSDYEKSFEDYASSFHFSADSLCTSMKNYITEEKPFYRAKEKGKSYRYAMEKYIKEHEASTTILSFNIKKLRALSGSADHIELLQQLKTVIESDLVEYNYYKKTPVYLSQVPKSLGGTYQGCADYGGSDIHGEYECDRYYSDSYLSYSHGLEACIVALDEPLTPLTQEGIEIFQKPFPILFATTLPWEMNSIRNELIFAGPLALGKDIPYMFVPAERIEYVKDWVKENVPGKKKPQVLAIDDFATIA